MNESEITFKSILGGAGMTATDYVESFWNPFPKSNYDIHEAVRMVKSDTRRLLNENNTPESDIDEIVNIIGDEIYNIAFTMNSKEILSEMLTGCDWLSSNSNWMIDEFKKYEFKSEEEIYDNDLFWTKQLDWFNQLQDYNYLTIDDKKTAIESLVEFTIANSK